MGWVAAAICDLCVVVCLPHASRRAEARTERACSMCVRHVCRHSLAALRCTYGIVTLPLLVRPTRTAPAVHGDCEHCEHKMPLKT